MSLLITLIIVLLVVGFIVYLVQSAPLPIDPWFRTAIIGIILIALIIWLLESFGFHTGIHLR